MAPEWCFALARSNTGFPTLSSREWSQKCKTRTKGSSFAIFGAYPASVARYVSSSTGLSFRVDARDTSIIYLPSFSVVMSLTCQQSLVPTSTCTKAGVVSASRRDRRFANHTIVKLYTNIAIGAVRCTASGTRLAGSSDPRCCLQSKCVTSIAHRSEKSDRICFSDRLTSVL